MASLLDVCLLLVLLKQGFEAGALIMRPYPPDPQHHDQDLLDIPSSFHEYPFMDLTMHPVSVEYFTQQASKAQTYHDILRIFYGRKDLMTDDIIDNLVTSQSAHSLYNLHLGRPRIGGLSDTTSFLLQRQRAAIQDRAMPPYMQDTPLDFSQDEEYHHGRDSRRHRRRKDPRHRHRHQDLRQELQEATLHLKEMEEKATCQLPVPVVLRIRDISPSANREYFPQCTIVHRCRKDSGCCNETSECAPKSNTTIAKYFLALEYKDSHVQPAQQIVESFTFENHTECECKPVQLIPKCLECPHPFYLRRENKTECSCDCFDKDRTCLRIKNGRRPLTEDQLRCIKEGSCHKPNCQYGEFEQDNVKSGYCPKKHRPLRTHQQHKYRSITPYRRKIGYR